MISHNLSDQLQDRVRKVLTGHAELATEVTAIPTSADLYEQGMTSRASVNVMLALEDEFDVEFPDSMLRRDVFESIDAISAAMAEIIDK